MLADECREAGLADVLLDQHGYVMATVPATVDRAVPTLGLAAHVDTYPGVTGAGVKPQVVCYEGGRPALPGDPAQVLTPRDMPALSEHVGHELVTSDGTTLLGADDKAGVAEIMAAAAYLVRHPEIEHGPIRVLFNPDEEVGRGTDHLDLAAFGADVAYTLDGSSRGEIEAETFSAVKATIAFLGRSAHSGPQRESSSMRSRRRETSSRPCRARDSLRKRPTDARASSIRTRSSAMSRRRPLRSSCATSTMRVSTSTSTWCAAWPARRRRVGAPRSR